MRIRISFLVIASLAVWALDLAPAQNKPTTASNILGLENKWNAAYQRGDIATMDFLLADDFIITVEDGTTFSKAGYIAHNGDSSVHVKKSEMSDLRVRMHGNTAVVTGAYYEKGTSKVSPTNTATASPMFGWTSIPGGKLSHRTTVFRPANNGLQRQQETFHLVPVDLRLKQWQISRAGSSTIPAKRKRETS